MNIELHLVRGMSDFNVVYSIDFFILWYSKGEPRDGVHDEENKGCNNECVNEASNAVTELIGELNIMMINPSTFDDSYTIECSDIIGRK